MSLTYLYNKLEQMDSREQYCYIQNILLQFQITPKFNLVDLFKDTPGKQASGKNPLGYLVMHLDLNQLQQLVPEYLVDLCGGCSFSNEELYMLSIIDDVMSNSYTYSLSKLSPNNSEMCNVFNFGVGKYSPWSFLKLNKYTLVPALFRHLYKYYNISKVDEETGISHLAHAACNIRMMQLIDMKGEDCNES